MKSRKFDPKRREKIATKQVQTADANTQKLLELLWKERIRQASPVAVTDDHKTVELPKDMSDIRKLAVADEQDTIIKDFDMAQVADILREVKDTQGHEDEQTQLYLMGNQATFEEAKGAFLRQKEHEIMTLKIEIAERLKTLASREDGATRENQEIIREAIAELKELEHNMIESCKTIDWTEVRSEFEQHQAIMNEMRQARIAALMPGPSGAAAAEGDKKKEITKDMRQRTEARKMLEENEGRSIGEEDDELEDGELPLTEDQEQEIDVLEYVHQKNMKEAAEKARLEQAQLPPSARAAAATAVPPPAAAAAKPGEEAEEAEQMAMDEERDSEMEEEDADNYGAPTRSKLSPELEELYEDIAEDLEDEDDEDDDIIPLLAGDRTVAIDLKQFKSLQDIHAAIDRAKEELLSSPDTDDFEGPVGDSVNDKADADDEEDGDLSQLDGFGLGASGGSSSAMSPSDAEDSAAQDDADEDMEFDDEEFETPYEQLLATLPPDVWKDHWEVLEDIVLGDGKAEDAMGLANNLEEDDSELDEILLSDSDFSREEMEQHLGPEEMDEFDRQTEQVSSDEQADVATTPSTPSEADEMAAAEEAEEDDLADYDDSEDMSGSEAEHHEAEQTSDEFEDDDVLTVSKGERLGHHEDFAGTKRAFRNPLLEENLDDLSSQLLAQPKRSASRYDLNEDVIKTMFDLHQADPVKYPPTRLGAMFGMKSDMVLGILRLRAIEVQAERMGLIASGDADAGEEGKDGEAAPRKTPRNLFAEAMSAGKFVEDPTSELVQGIKRDEKQLMPRLVQDAEFQFMKKQDELRRQQFKSKLERVVEEEGKYYSEVGAIGSAPKPPAPTQSLSEERQSPMRYNLILTDISEASRGQNRFQVVVRDKDGTLRTPTPQEFWAVRLRERAEKLPFRYSKYTPGTVYVAGQVLKTQPPQQQQ